MSGFAAVLVMVMSVLSAPKGWFGAQEAVKVHVSGAGARVVVLADLFGNTIEARGDANVVGEKDVVVEDIFPQIRRQAGTYVLYLVPKEGGLSKEGTIEAFEGTPLVIEARQDPRIGSPAGVMVTRVEPLRYAVIKTEKGEMRAVLYYDVAPNTVENFIRLAREGFYNGLTFFRIVPGFVIQTGDPRGDGTGGPGYSVDAEFSDRAHVPGVMSMARMSDPNEPRLMPRAEFANSAGSQFFICLDYDNTKQLDQRYTAFGRVIEGLDVMDAIGKGKVADERTGKAADPVGVKEIEIRDVTPGDNLYLRARVGKLDLAPTTVPVEGKGKGEVKTGAEPATKPVRPATGPSQQRVG